MLREVVHIDENLCDGCGDCVPACHEGALQIIDGKARLISDLMCDGLGACLGHCPQDAITIEKREAEPYDEIKVMEIMVEKGYNTIVAHLKHLKEHNETEYLKAGVEYLNEHAGELDFNIEKVMKEVHHGGEQHDACGCPGSQARSFEPGSAVMDDKPGMVSGQSELRQWPVQMHLINPRTAYFQNSDVVLAADCVAYSLGDFHQKWLKGKTLAIACPKLDEGQESYVENIRSLIDDAGINTLTVMMMQVPCCRGILSMAQAASQQATRKVPVKAVVVGVEGEILTEDWV